MSVPLCHFHVRHPDRLAVRVVCLVTGAMAGWGHAAQAQSSARHVATESQVVHRPQETYLLPSGWKASDSYTWHTVQEQVPAVLTQSHKIESPDGTEIISWERDVAARWSAVRLSNGMGADTQSVQEFRDADTGSEMFVRAFERNHPGVTVKILAHSDKPCPSENEELVSHTRLVPGGMKPTAAAYQSMVLYTYTLNGVPTLHLSSGIYDRLRFASTDDGTLGSRGVENQSGTWHFRVDSNVIAPAKQFKSVCALAEKILPSIKIDPVWQKAYERIATQRIRELTAKIEGDINASRLQQANASDDALRNWKRQQAINDAFGEQQNRFLRNAPLDVKYLDNGVIVTTDHSQSQDQ